MKNKRKPLVVTLIVIACVAAVAAGIWFFWLKDYLSAAGASPVYVNPISSIMGLDTGSNPKYSGIVEPQETYKINKDDTKTVAEIAVKEGDEVHVGDLLFSYDTEQMQIDLDQAEIDLEGIAQQITVLKNQKTDLEAEKKKVSEDEQYAYTVRIQEVELQIKQQENASKTKKSEVDKLQEAMSNADVLSEVEGVVKEVNANPQDNPYTGQASAFISILSSGEFRIKGTISELNLPSLSVGQAVTVHSRIDPEQEWKGSVDSIDQEASTDQNNNGMVYYGGMDSGERSSRYNFYVALENPEGLILGQHVYIEPDLGASTKKEGLWLPAMYIAHDDSGSFVWAKNDRDKLEKRMVILGDYDKDLDMYQIKSGVTRVDSIAYPSDTLKPGMPTTMDASLQGAYMNTPNGGAGISDFGGADGSMAGGDMIGGMDGSITDSGMTGGMDDGITDGTDGGVYDDTGGDFGYADDGTGDSSYDGGSASDGEGYTE